MQLGVDFLHGLFVELQHLAVICIHSVDLELDVADLSIDSGAKSFLYQRDDLLFVQLLISRGELLLRPEHDIAEALLLVPYMAVENHAVSAVFAYDERSAVKLRHMNRQDIFVHALEVAALLIVPAARVVNDSRGIVCLDGIADLLRVELTPALVEGHPAADAGAVIEIVYHLEQLAAVVIAPLLFAAAEPVIFIILDADADIRQNTRKDISDILAAADHILPDYHAESVAVIVPAQGLDLDMLSEHIKAEALHLGDIKYHRFVVGWSQTAVAPIALIEQAALEIGLVIEHKARQTLLILADAELSHAEIALDGIDSFAVFLHGEYKVIESRALGAPELRIGHGKMRVELHLAGIYLLAAERNLSLYRAAVKSLAGAGDDYLARVDIGGQAHAGDMALSHGLKPHGLPDSGGSGIPEADGFENLLAAILPALVGRVIDLDNKLVFAVDKFVCYIKRERAIAAGMSADRDTVDKHLALPIDSAEMQNAALIIKAAVESEPLSVPKALVGLKRALNAGELALDGERQDYLAAEIFRASVARRGYLIIALAVEAHPILAHKLWAGILRKRTVFVHIVKESGFQIVHLLNLRNLIKKSHSIIH